MCGLAGYLSHKSFPDSVLVRMTERLAHRGPDAEGYYRNGPLALGHRRLSIIDIAGSPQPMSTPDGELTIIFNGEIYNFAAIATTRLESMPPERKLPSGTSETSMLFTEARNCASSSATASSSSSETLDE